MNDKDILKYLALQLLEYAVEVVLAMVILLGGLWIIGWTVELIAEYVPFPITLRTWSGAGCARCFCR